MKKWIFLYSVIGFLLLPSLSFGFILTVTPTPEYCSGNGALAFNVANTDPNGTIAYVIYKLPNTTTVFAAVSTNFLNNISAGNYRVIATETVGSTSTSQTQDATVNSTFVPLNYNIQSLNQACSLTSNVSIITTSGIAVSYAIISGPVTFPAQSSNTFSGLPVGTYGFDVFDNCGNGRVKSYTVTLNPTGLTIGQPAFSNTTPSSCNFTNVTNIITAAPGTVIGYPLIIQYSVNPPGGGAPIVTNQTLATGDSVSQPLTATIPFYINQNYTYDLSITDACGTFVTTNFNASQEVTLSAEIKSIGCNSNYFVLSTTNFTPPYTLNFTAFPAGFNPNAFNSDYPGPYTLDTVEFGSTSNPAPFGNYIVTITDTCGRTPSVPTSFSFSSIAPNPVATTSNNGCLTSTERIVVAIYNYMLATAIITSAPATYPFSLPHDVSSFIDINGILILDPLPLGVYVIAITDTCNDSLSPLTLAEPVYVNQGLVTDLRPGCALQKSSVKIASFNGVLTSVTITAAPPAFPQTLPYVATSNIANTGTFYMADLPAGNYTFETIDVCNFHNSANLVVVGYAITTANYSLQHNCGSFNIPLNFVTNANANESFYLQKLLDTATNTWGDPAAGVSYTTYQVYTDGTKPNSINSIILINNTSNLNLSFNGTFRIVHYFSSYNSGSDINSAAVLSADKDCTEFYNINLNYDEVLAISGAFRMPCSPSGTLDVLISAMGTAPLHYLIDQKNGLPFTLDNGTSNIFSNLPAAVYHFIVQDPCGGSTGTFYDVSDLISLAIANKPADLLQCQSAITGNETFDFTINQSAAIFGIQNRALYTLNYYTSLSDAQSAINPITNLTAFNPTTNPQTIYARIFFNQLPNCYQTTSFDLHTGQNPTLNLNPAVLNCTATPVLLDATGTNLLTTTYLWSDGTTTPTITISQFGITNLSITATNAYGTAALPCTNTQNVVVTISQPPTIDHIEITDWTADQNSITVISTNPAAFDYSIDGSNFQDSNTISNLIPGVYTVTIRDKNGCGIITQQVWLLNYPKFFTPNDDSFNDKWMIPNSGLEPDLKVNIYDRYGKLLSSITSTNAGWDGTFNGKPLLADDYWFVIQRQDGRILNGHFALKR